MSILENILKSIVLDEAKIIEKTKLSDTAYKIRLQGKSISHINFVPGSFLRMGVGIGTEELSMKDKIRSYSIWDINQQEGFMDIAIATHSNGIGSKWITNCQPGDKVYYKLKKGNFLADETAANYLMIGDLSALSHLYMINRNIGKQKQVASIIYSQHLHEFFADVDHNSPFDFYEMPKEPITEILTKIKAILPTLHGVKMVYIAGDSRVCIALNQFFRKELNWDTKQIKTKPFWNPVKKGLE